MPAPKRPTTSPTRCSWAKSDLNIPYHDAEWGVPVRNDRLLFEFLILEGAQAGLSWDTILKKRDHYRKVFNNFDAAKVARYDSRKTAALLKDEGIIRNRAKIASAVANARAFLKTQEEFDGFAPYIWQFVNGEPIVNKRRSPGDVPAVTPEAVAMSKDLKRRGFSFIGPTICYAFMQATGMVNDHLVSCFRYRELVR